MELIQPQATPARGSAPWPDVAASGTLRQARSSEGVAPMMMACMGEGFFGTAMMLAMGATALALLVALVLAVTALAKYVFFS